MHADEPVAKTTNNVFKIHVKRFCQWLYQSDKGEYPEKIKWIEYSATRNDITKDQLLTREELKRLIKQAGNSRNRAIIAITYESAMRPDINTASFPTLLFFH